MIVDFRNEECGFVWEDACGSFEEGSWGEFGAVDGLLRRLQGGREAVYLAKSEVKEIR